MIYTIFLDGNKIGTSLLEKADPPMGVVFGKIQSDNNSLTYDVINDYCKDKGVTVTKYPEDKLILTQTIPTLKVFNENKIEIVGVSNSIEGMDSEGFDIHIIGISYPFYEKEFFHHVNSYGNLFS